MTNNYHTPHSTTKKIPATGATLNAPLGELDDALTTAYNDISTLQIEMDEAQGNISTLQSQIAAAIPPIALCGRLTLESGNPESGLVSDANTIYFTPYKGNLSVLYGPSGLIPVKFSELALSLDYGPGIEQGSIYDVYLVNDNGTLRIGFGPAWASQSNRGVGALSAEIVLKEGIWVNANAMVLTCGMTHIAITVNPFNATYLGSFLATGTGNGGKTCDDATRGYLFNAYNQIDRQNRIYSDNSHAYAGQHVQNWNGTRETELSVLVGLQGQIADFFVLVCNDDLVKNFMVFETEATGEPQASNVVELGACYDKYVKKSGAGKACCSLGRNTSIVKEIGSTNGYARYVRASLTVKR